MANPVSSYPVFRAALVAALNSTAVQSILQPPVQVADGEQVMPEPDMVWILDVEDGKQETVYSGQYRKETYTQPVLIQTVQSDIASAALAVDRAFQLMGAIEMVLRGGLSGVGGDPTVGASVQWALVVGWKFQEGILAKDGSQRGCSLTMSISVRATI